MKRVTLYRTTRPVESVYSALAIFSYRLPLKNIGLSSDGFVAGEQSADVLLVESRSVRGCQAFFLLLVADECVAAKTLVAELHVREHLERDIDLRADRIQILVKGFLGYREARDVNWDDARCAPHQEHQGKVGGGDLYLALLRHVLDALRIQ